MSYQQEVFNLISSFTGHNANYVVPKEFMRMLKDSNSALILSQLVYWTGRQADPDGWIYKSYADWESEIFLSKKSVMIAVKRLKKIDVVETQVRKVRLDNGMLGDTCVHYQVNQKKLADLILNQLKSLGSAQRELLFLLIQRLQTKTTTTYWHRLHQARNLFRIKKKNRRRRFLNLI